MSTVVRVIALLLVALAAAPTASAAWHRAGPDGAPVDDIVTVRAADGRRVVAAVGLSGLYLSWDGAETWNRDPRVEPLGLSCGASELRADPDRLRFRCRLAEATRCLQLPWDGRPASPCADAEVTEGPLPGAPDPLERLLIEHIAGRSRLPLEDLGGPARVAKDGRRVYLGHPLLGVFRSDDDGQTFTHRSRGMDGLAVIHVQAAPGGDVNAAIAAPRPATEAGGPTRWLRLSYWVCHPVDRDWECGWRDGAVPGSVSASPTWRAGGQEVKPRAVPREIVAKSGAPEGAAVLSVWPWPDDGQRASMAGTVRGLLIAR